MAGLCINCFHHQESAGKCPHCGFDESKLPVDEILLPPRTLLNQGKYLVGRPLGAGGFGITYLGYDTVLLTRVAIKEYLPRWLAHRRNGDVQVSVPGNSNGEVYQYGLEKFLDEARALARFKSEPGVVSVLNFFQENNTAYIVMEYVDGLNIKQFLQHNDDKIEWPEAVKIMLPVLKTLHQIHSEALIHRDISPDNIYLGRNGQVKILDFGAARCALGEQTSNLSVILKQGYAPVEQYSARGNQGPWTDVYAAGATLFRMVTGFSPPDAAARVEDDILDNMIDRNDRIPAGGKAILKQALAIKPSERYQSCRQMAEALQEMTGPGPAGQAGLYSEQRGWFDLYVVVAAMVLAVAGLTGFSYAASLGLIDQGTLALGLFFTYEIAFHVIIGMALYRVAQNRFEPEAWWVWIPIIQSYYFGKLAGPLLLGKRRLNLGVPLMVLILIQNAAIANISVYGAFLLLKFAAMMFVFYRFMLKYDRPRAQLYTFLAIITAGLLYPFFLYRCRNNRPASALPADPV